MQEAIEKHLDAAVLLDDTPEVAMDAAQMPWSITALLSAAVRHAPVHGGVTVGARGSHHRVEVSVSDTGIGMSAA